MRKPGVCLLDTLGDLVGVRAPLGVMDPSGLPSTILFLSCSSSCFLALSTWVLASAWLSSCRGSGNGSLGELEKSCATWEMIWLENLMIRKCTPYCKIIAPKPLNRPENPSSWSVCLYCPKIVVLITWRIVEKQSATPSYLVRMGTTEVPVSRLSMMLLVPWEKVVSTYTKQIARPAGAACGARFQGGRARHRRWDDLPGRLLGPEEKNYDMTSCDLSLGMLICHCLILAQSWQVRELGISWNSTPEPLILAMGGLHYLRVRMSTYMS